MTSALATVNSAGFGRIYLYLNGRNFFTLEEYPVRGGQTDSLRRHVERGAIRPRVQGAHTEAHCPRTHEVIEAPASSDFSFLPDVASDVVYQAKLLDFLVSNFLLGESKPCPLPRERRTNVHQVRCSMPYPGLAIRNIYTARQNRRRSRGGRSGSLRLCLPTRAGTHLLGLFARCGCVPTQRHLSTGHRGAHAFPRARGKAVFFADTVNALGHFLPVFFGRIAVL